MELTLTSPQPLDLGDVGVELIKLGVLHPGNHVPIQYAKREVEQEAVVEVNILQLQENDTIVRVVYPDSDTEDDPKFTVRRMQKVLVDDTTKWCFTFTVSYPLLKEKEEAIRSCLSAFAH